MATRALLGFDGSFQRYLLPPGDRKASWAQHCSPTWWASGFTPDRELFLLIGRHFLLRTLDAQKKSAKGLTSVGVIQIVSDKYKPSYSTLNWKKKKHRSPSNKENKQYRYSSAPFAGERGKKEREVFPHPHFLSLPLPLPVGRNFCWMCFGHNLALNKYLNWDITIIIILLH